MVSQDTDSSPMHPAPVTSEWINTDNLRSRILTIDSCTNEGYVYLLGSGLRIAIVHARWNTAIIENLVAGAKKSLFAAGVKEENITIQTVPGSYELPIGVQRYVSTPLELYTPLNPSLLPLATHHT